MEGKPDQMSRVVFGTLIFLKIYTFAWLFGFFVALLSYYIICTFISPITSALVDEAVLPQQKGDVSPRDDSTGGAYEAKDGFHTHTKEIV